MQVKDLKFDKRNYRKHNKENLDLISKSIKEVGFGRSIVINSDNEIICGNGVTSTLQQDVKLKVVETDGTELIVVKRNDLKTGDIKQTKLGILDNSASDSSEFDLELLSEDFNPSELIEMGINSEDLEGITNNDSEEIQEDETPEIQEKEVSKLGDLWILGNHRLLCGDSTKIEDIEKLMNKGIADLVLTDPPYGINVVKCNKVGGDNRTHFGRIENNNIVKATKYIPIQNDNSTESAELSYKILKEFSKNQIIFGGNYFTAFLPPKSCWIVWDKENTGNFSDVELAWTSFNKGAVLYKWLWNGLCRKGSRDIEGIKRIHPTQKPVGLLGEILKDFSNSEEVILDVFGGSGSTLIACEQLNRKCYMMEIEPKYCDVIIRRWQNLTSQKAILESSGQTFEELDR